MGKGRKGRKGRRRGQPLPLAAPTATGPASARPRGARPLQRSGARLPRGAKAARLSARRPSPRRARAAWSRPAPPGHRPAPAPPLGPRRSRPGSAPPPPAAQRACAAPRGGAGARTGALSGLGGAALRVGFWGAGPGCERLSPHRFWFLVLSSVPLELKSKGRSLGARWC